MCHGIDHVIVPQISSASPMLTGCLFPAWARRGFFPPRAIPGGVWLDPGVRSDRLLLLKVESHLCLATGVCFAKWAVRLSFHTVIQWFRLEGTLKSTWFQHSCHGHGTHGTHFPDGDRFVLMWSIFF